MALEGLWTVRFASVAGEAVQSESAGVVMLDNGRLIGGDTWSYFLGTYQHGHEGKVELLVHVRTHFAQHGESIFGGPLAPYTLKGQASVGADADTVSAVFQVEGLEGARMVAIMKRVPETEIRELTARE
jgi:hypothetical protein